MANLYDQDEYDPDIEFDPTPRKLPRRAETEVDPAQFQYYCDLQRTKQYLPYAAAGAMIGAAAGAAVWVALTAFTGLQLRWPPVAIGVLAGVLARVTGRGIDPKFGLVAALMATLGFVAGDLLAGCWLVSRETVDAGFLDIVSALTPGLAFTIVKDLYSHIDLMFYAVGLVTAYWIAIRHVKPRHAVGIELPVGLRLQMGRESSAA